jgi:hypothetical protein
MESSCRELNKSPSASQLEQKGIKRATTEHNRTKAGGSFMQASAFLVHLGTTSGELFCSNIPFAIRAGHQSTTNRQHSRKKNIKSQSKAI